jgi:hypothetical protein
VIFWGHSSGPVGLFGDSATPVSQPTRLTLPKLKNVMRRLAGALGDKGRQESFARVKAESRKAAGREEKVEGTHQPIDILLFKNCWIATLETALELRHVARYMIASQNRVPQEGFPYAHMFRILSAQHQGEDEVSVKADKLLSSLEFFYDQARNRVGKAEVPFSRIDLNRVEPIAVALSNLVDGKESVPQDALERASRGDAALVDLVALSNYLGRGRKHHDRTVPLRDSVRDAVKCTLR